MIRSITAHVFPYDRTHDLYQEYYRRALQSFCKTNRIPYTESSRALSDRLLRSLRTVRHSYKLHRIAPQGTTKLVDRVAGLTTRRLMAPEPIGTYDIELQSGDILSVAIDANDSGALASSEPERYDVYFKSNYWPTRDYPENVRPLANLNPLVGQNLDYFIKLRETPKTVDLFAFFRIWGGSDELQGVEHNLNLIESLSKAPGNNFVVAYLVAGDIPRIAARLDRLGIRWTTTPMNKFELWEMAAAARLNLVRLGMHECIPWRMTDILAMGGCPIVDYDARTRWPQPLQEGKHLLSLHSPMGKPPATNIPERIATWLQDLPLLDRIGANTAKYFDTNLAPPSLGNNLLASVRGSATHI